MFKRLPCQAVVYGVEFDASIRRAVKGSVSPEDFMEYGPVREALEAVGAGAENGGSAPGEDDGGEDMEAGHEDAAGTQLDTQSGSAPGPLAGGSAPHAAADAVWTIPKNVDEDQFQKWKSFSHRICQERVKILVMPPTINKLVEIIKHLQLAKATSDNKHKCGVFWEVGKSGEPITRPNLRTAPLRAQHFKKA